MSKSEQIYAGLCVFFASILILGNMTYQKFVSLPLMIHTFELSVGAILYPLTFLVSDLITEFFGKAKAQFCIRLALITNALVVTIIAFMDHLPATSWSKISDDMFHNVFGCYGVAFIGSIIACYAAQSIDVRLYSLIRSITKGRYIWLRSNISTSISLLVDTSLVICFMALFGILPSENVFALIANSYSWKLFFSVASTPLFYLCVISIKSLADLSISNCSSHKDLYISG